VRKLVSIATLLSLLCTPLLLHAQRSACEQARYDAKNEVQGTVWLILGCVLGPFGPPLAIFIKKSPPPERFIGKSAEYVAEYTQCYDNQSFKSQLGNSMIGCAVWSALLLTGMIANYIIPPAGNAP
jgi:hypothetical protein